jgi:DNA-binding CsgD family transcriptional regulator/tetratricopeptide (TPR) repeat protein
MPQPLHTTLIGRDTELATLRNLLGLAAQGAGQVVLLTGEAGVGKTRLLDEALANQPCAVLTGRAREDSNPPYGPITGVLRSCFRYLPTDPIRREPLLTHLGHLLPELGPAGAEPAEDTLIEAILRLIVLTATETCCVVHLEDLHWADTATLEMLAVLADRLQHERVVLIGTYLSDDLPRGHPLRRLRNELRRTRRLKEIMLEPLRREDSLMVVAQALGTAPTSALADLIIDKTGGIPLYLEELSQALLDGGHLEQTPRGLALRPGSTVPLPESIRDAMLLRLDVLSEDARRQLEIAAVVGLEFPLSLISGLSSSERGLDELMERQVLVETAPGRAAFRHALLRDAVRAEITWSHRRALHRAVGEALSTQGAEPEVIAEHWLAANELPRARAALLASAHHSCRVHAYRDAGRAVSRALDIWPEGHDEAERVAALEQAAHCAQLGGQLAEAVRAWREVVSSPLLVEDTLRRAAALRSLATVYSLQGASEHSIEMRRQASAAFESVDKIADAAIEILAAALRLTSTSQLAGALDAARQASELAEKAAAHDTQARALGLQGEILAMQGKFEDGRETAQAGLSLALRHNESEAASDVYRRLANSLTSASDYNAARKVYSTALDFCRTNGIEVYAQVCLSCMSYVLFMSGDWKQAQDVCEEVMHSSDSPPGSRITAEGILGMVRGYRGETRLARRHLRKALADARRSNIVLMELCAHWGLAVVDDFDDMAESSEANFLRVLDCLDRTQDTHDMIAPVCSAVAFFAERGMDAEANRSAEALAHIAGATAGTEAMAGLAYALGETALLNNELTVALSQFEQALVHLETLDIPLARARVYRRLGLTQLRVGTLEAGIVNLRSAYRIVRKLGSRPLAARIAADLAALGETAEERRSSELPGPAMLQGLTQRQLEVARLVAGGLTNKEIAQKLFLSPRTVDMHVANILVRLDCRSRTEAVRRATEFGLLDKSA